VTQPTLSAGIRRLEEEIGFPIVRRERRYEGLTPEGERVHAWALQILADVTGLDAEIGAMRGGLRGKVRIGAIPTSLPSVPALTRPLVVAHPAATVSIHSLNSRQIERGLHDFELDLGVTYLDNEPLSGVRSLALYEERYLLLTPVAGPFGSRREVRWAEAAKTPLCLLTEDMQNRRIVNTIFAEVGARPNPAIETNSISTLYAHLKDGQWSSVVAPAWLALFPVPPAMVALPLVRPTVVHAIGLVWLDRDPEPLAVRAVVELARSS
jgi:DNA-binding transcriptional LysR family regulator